jgi:Ca-activated chloride channel family protein
MAASILPRARVLIFAGSLALSPLSFAQYDGPITPRLNPRMNARISVESLPPADLRVDVPLVLIPVHVTTPLGVSVTDLHKNDFRLFEDGVEQHITHFASEDAPLSIGVLFDASGSMKNKISKSAEAVAAFFRTSNAEDEFFLIEFNERPRLAVPFTQDSDAIYKHVARTHAIGRTSLLDAIHLALVQMKTAKNLRKAIVIVSDGGDNRSRYTESEIKSAMREADVQVYALGIFDPDDQPKRTREEKDGPRLLGELADETGGRHYPVQNLNDLPELCARIGNELRNEYLIGYAPTSGADDGKYRHVKVNVVPPQEMPPLRAHHRQGYYAASGQ